MENNRMNGSCGMGNMNSGCGRRMTEDRCVMHNRNDGCGMRNVNEGCNGRTGNNDCGMRDGNSGCGMRSSGRNCGSPVSVCRRMCRQTGDLGDMPLDQLPLAMGYVPMQRFGRTFELGTGLEAGTIFPELHKPFCGKGGAGCR